MLRDRIVWGINDEAIQRKLLQEATLTYAKAITLAQSFETASNNLKEMHAPTTELTASSSTGVTVKTEPVHKMSVKRDKPRQTWRFRSDLPSLWQARSPGHCVQTSGERVS